MSDAVCPRCHESDRIEQATHGPWCRRCLSYLSMGGLSARESRAAYGRWIPPPDFPGPPLARGGSGPGTAAAEALMEAARDLGPDGGPLAQGPVCRSCGAPIRWARTRAGKAVPLDAEPADDGNVVLQEDGTARVLTRRQMDGGGVAAPRYTSHFATCPDAARHRRRAKDLKGADA